MKKSLVAIISLSLFFVSCAVIEPGHVGIIVNKFGSEKGVSNYTAQTGVVLFNPFTTHVFNYPIFVQTAVWSKSPNEGRSINEEITFNTKEGTSISCDVTFSYQLVKDSVPFFYVKFRSDDLILFTDGFLHNVARDAFTETASQYELESLYGVKKQEFMIAVRARVNSEITKFGVNLIQLGFAGDIRMDPLIKAALNRKMATTQEAIAAENKSRQFRADSLNAVIVAQGQAAANEIIARSITSSVIQWKQLQLQEAAITKWDSKLPAVVGGTNQTMIPLPNIK